MTIHLGLLGIALINLLFQCNYSHDLDDKLYGHLNDTVIGNSTLYTHRAIWMVLKNNVLREKNKK